MEQFKSVHKEAEAVRSEGLTTEDIRQDIKSMEDERDQLVKRIERLKKKVDRIEMPIPNAQTIFNHITCL